MYLIQNKIKRKLINIKNNNNKNEVIFININYHNSNYIIYS